MASSCQAFEQELHEALAHLYDPDYTPSRWLCESLGFVPREGTLSLQTSIIRAIDGLKPPPDTPPTARTRRVFQVLRNRFVLKLTQEQTAECMHLSRGSVLRAQREAIHTLAAVLWERLRTEELAAGDSVRDDMVRAQALDWRSQVERELASLQEKSPGTVSDVADAIDSVLEFLEALVSESGARVEIMSVQPGLIAAVHPVLLHQVLISALKQLVLCTSGGPIAVGARLEDGNAKITLMGAVTAECQLTEEGLVGDIPVPSGVSIELCIDGEQAFIWIEAPSVGRVTVLVVDDNEDMARLYRGAAVGTRYHVVHVTEGQALFEAIQIWSPDIVVLDVMLPDIDGWRLLMRLHADPATRPIPVVVCSVVREEELALSLGAVRFLAKPVRPREFIRVLDQVLPQGSTAAPRRPASSAEAC
jgi:CheY-like chemotaxis protein